MPSEMRFGGVCIQDVALAGSFGVLMVAGRFCEGTTDDVVSAVEALVKIPPQRKPALNVLASFPLPGHYREPGQLTIYRGEPAVLPQPNSTAKFLSFSCSRAEGGAQ